MQFDWTTFVLEAINFLILVWILKHFFYRPVLDVLDARQKRVHTEVARAEQLQQESESLKQQYETRLADWSKEREQARQQLDRELTQLRAAGIQDIKKALAGEEAKARARDAAMVTSRARELIRKATGDAYSNAAAMLQRLASPELTLSIVRMFQEDLSTLPPAEHEALRKAGQALGANLTVDIAAAHSLDDRSLAEINKALSAAVGQPLKVAFKITPELIAGLRVAVGECLLHANLSEELAFFKRQDEHAR